MAGPRVRGEIQKVSSFLVSRLGKTMEIISVLYNSEVCQGLTATDLTILEVVDHQLLRLICDGHSKTPIEFCYLETASLPLKSILSSRRIMYLHHILGRN